MTRLKPINPEICVRWFASPGRDRRLHMSCWGKTHSPSWGAQEQPGRCCPQPGGHIEATAPDPESLYCTFHKTAMYILDKIRHKVREMDTNVYKAVLLYICSFLLLSPSGHILCQHILTCRTHTFHELILSICPEAEVQYPGGVYNRREGHSHNVKWEALQKTVSKLNYRTKM